MFGGIRVDGFIHSAVNRQIGLSIAVKIQLPHHDLAGHRIFKYAGGNTSALPFNLARFSDIERNDVHQCMITNFAVKLKNERSAL